MEQYGAYSEVGKLRKVIVHRPGLEMRRLTPTNCVELLFDDVIWARKARQEHDAFVDLMRTEFGVDVMRVHELLQDVVSDPEGRAYILDRKLVPNEVGVGGTAELRAWMDEMDSATLTAHLIGGVTVMELPADFRKRVEKAYAGTDFVLPPLPNQLFTRDSSCWIYGGVTVNPMYWPARRKETLHLTAIYKYHPKFKGGDFNDLVGRSGRGPRQRHPRGRRRDADRQRRGSDRDGRAHHLSGGQSGGAAALQSQRRRTRHRGQDAGRPGQHAPGHHLQLLRPGPGHDL